MARFIDLFVLGDGEESLAGGVRAVAGAAGGRAADRERTCWPRWPRGCRYAYVPRFYEPQYDGRGPAVWRCRRCRERARRRSSRPCWPTWTPCRCPPRRSCRTSSACRTASRSRSCGAAPGAAASARARRSSGRSACRKVETIVAAAVESYRNTGYNEISLLWRFPPATTRSSTSCCGRLHESLPAAGREHLAAQPADQRAIAVARRLLEHRPPRRA